MSASWRFKEGYQSNVDPDYANRKKIIAATSSFWITLVITVGILLCVLAVLLIEKAGIEDCSQPIWYWAFGLAVLQAFDLVLFFLVWTVYLCVKAKNPQRNYYVMAMRNPVRTLVGLVGLGWLFYGCYLVIRAEDECSVSTPVLFKFVLGYLVITFVIFLLLCCVGPLFQLIFKCCVGCLTCCCPWAFAGEKRQKLPDEPVPV